MEEIKVEDNLEKLSEPMPNMNDPRKPFHILSIISLMLLVTSVWPFYRNSCCIWSLIEFCVSIMSKTKEIDYFPIQMSPVSISTFVFLTTVVGAVVFVIFTTCRRNNGLFNGMFGKNTMFHFIPYLFVAAVFCTCQNFDTFQDLLENPYLPEDEEFFKVIEEKLKLNRTYLILDLIFTILGLISLLVFYCSLNLEKSPWYLVMAIKNGIFSIFIVLLWYNFFHIIICLRAIVVFIDGKSISGLKNFYEKTGISFCVIIGIVVLLFSIRYRDIMMQFVNFLMYSGIVMTYYNKIKSERDAIKDEYNDGADGIIATLIMIASLISIPVTTLCSRNLFS